MRTDDIVRQRFAKVFRGYDVQEVDLFLDDIIREMDRYEHERNALLMRLEALLKELEHCDRLLCEYRKKERAAVDASMGGAAPEVPINKAAQEAPDKQVDLTQTDAAGDEDMPVLDEAAPESDAAIVPGDDTVEALIDALISPPEQDTAGPEIPVITDEAPPPVNEGDEEPFGGGEAPAANSEELSANKEEQRADTGEREQHTPLNEDA